MIKTLQHLRDGIEDWGGITSPDFKKFASTFKRELKKELKVINATDIVFNIGHYYISGFFTVGEQAYYFSISDVRYFPEEKMLVRTAKHYKDFTGGANNYIKIGVGMFKNFNIR